MLRGEPASNVIFYWLKCTLGLCIPHKMSSLNLSQVRAPDYISDERLRVLQLESHWRCCQVIFLSPLVCFLNNCFSGSSCPPGRIMLFLLRMQGTDWMADQDLMDFKPPLWCRCFNVGMELMTVSQGFLLLLREWRLTEINLGEGTAAETFSATLNFNCGIEFSFSEFPTRLVSTLLSFQSCWRQASFNYILCRMN